MPLGLHLFGALHQTMAGSRPSCSMPLLCRITRLKALTVEHHSECFESKPLTAQHSTVGVH